MRELRICHLYPDVLNLYGDRGNVLCLQKRLAWRGLDCELTELPMGERKPLSGFDLFFIGGGQDFEQGLLLEDLSGGKGADIRSAVEDGAPFLCVCGGYQLMGAYYETHDGKRCGFLGAADFYTVGGEKRMIGPLAFDMGGYTVAGFENHSGRTFLGPGLSPLGRVVSGNGNNGEDGGEGLRYKNLFGTYSHGPVLPKNPELCDLLLKTALERKYGDGELSPLPDAAERAAHDSVLDTILKKGSKRHEKL